MASWESAISSLYGNSGPKTVKSYNVAINACGKGNQWQLAVFLLEDLKVRTFQPDVVTLNSLISACREQWLLALHLLHEMIQGYSVDVISFSAAIRACERAGVWQLALSLLQQMKEQMLQSNVIVHNSVLSVFSQAGEWERALLWLRNMKEQMACTTISYNTAITACARSAQWLQAIHLLSFESFESVSTDIISYNAAINSCEDSGLWELALQLYGQLQESSLQRNVVTFGSIISTCGNGSRWEVAMYFLQELQSSDLQANLITLNASLMACERSQRWSTALQLLRDGLNTTLIPNIVSFNVAISTCGKAGQMLLVRRLLLRLNRLGLEPNLITCNAVLNSCVATSGWEQALAMLHQAVLEDLQPDLTSYNAASNACVSASRWPEALALLKNAALGHLDLDRISYTTAINAYERGDKWQEAIALLASFPGEADAILFNAAINACADQWQKCVLLLNQMQQDQIQANIITFGAIISACRNSKEWREAVHILGFMQRSHVETNAIVCNAAINACGRAEYWPHALQILVMMEKETIEADLTSYDTLIAATASCGCREQAWMLAADSRPLRSPLEVLWALATVSCNDAEVIHAALVDVVSAGRADTAKLLWCMGQLGVSPVRSFSRQFLRDIQGRQLEDLILAAGAVAPHPELTFFYQLQQAAEERIVALQPSALVFQRLGISALGLLSSCHLAQLLQQGFVRCVQRCMQRVGRAMDSCEGPWGPWPRPRGPPEVTADSPSVAADYGDRAILYKPEGWEVYGAHTKRQLSMFVRCLGDRRIFSDQQHNLGFLHRLDVPSSGLIMCAKTYEAFYDLQVQLHAGLFCRDYIVLSHGWLPQSLTHIQAHLISSSSGPSLSGGRGKYSCTKLLSVAHIARANWATSFSQLLIRIVTGRKHQIRSQLSFVGHPTVRDALYTSLWTFSDDGKICSRNWLHRHRLEFQDQLGRRQEVISPLPQDLRESMLHLRQNGLSAAGANLGFQ
ncbi:unnamed protein product [Cladocopium goreaui]|uniref:Pentatricopeptide repeat-containing protein, chloroplastic n=1 Tax=Cladocopium goreaui TaxID=2562237 RepID=A0A9P1DBI0_9DINO|nr:unnamed protein product [Cladocopium goreaui]